MLYARDTSGFSFPDNNFSKYQWVFTKLAMCIDIVEVCLGMLIAKFHQFLTVICPGYESGKVLSFHIFIFSYDEQLLVWDSRQMRKPLTDIGLGGGIWRIKWEPTRGDKILTATMYNGFHIIDTKTLKGNRFDTLRKQAYSNVLKILQPCFEQK